MKKIRKIQEAIKQHGDEAAAKFSERQQKVVRQIGKKDTFKVTKLTKQMLENCCPDCKIIMQTSNERICKACLIKNKDIIKELIIIKKKMRGF